MTLAAKLTALLEGFTRYQIAGLTRAERQQLANAAERVLLDCRKVDAPKAGVVAQLNQGDRSQ
jgi:hypothetical protein